MNPYSHYIDCVNCGNELISINELTFQTPEKLRCDYCGMEYKSLARKVKRTKRLVGITFVVAGILLFISAYSLTGITGGLFALFPLLIIYYFFLGVAIKKISW